MRTVTGPDALTTTFQRNPDRSQLVTHADGTTLAVDYAADARVGGGLTGWDDPKATWRRMFDEPHDVYMIDLGALHGMNRR